MAKGREKHQARLDAIAWLGKDLARRASRRCELCGDNHDLRPYDAEPEVREPTMDTVALLCSRCRAVADGRPDDPQSLRFLENSMWSEVPAVRETSKRILRRLNADWARQALDLVGE